MEEEIGSAAARGRRGGLRLGSCRGGRGEYRLSSCQCEEERDRLSSCQRLEGLEMESQLPGKMDGGEEICSAASRGSRGGDEQLPGGVGEEIDSAASRGSRGGDRLSICRGVGVSHIDFKIL